MVKTARHGTFRRAFCWKYLVCRKEVIILAYVTLRPNESQDSILKRFRKKVVKSGVLSTIRRKRWFVSKSELRRVEKKKAARRVKRRQVTHD
jgi:small subunit ribosomal protein S21